jgi:hypothetical protein
MAAGGDPILQLPRYGRMLARYAAGRLEWIVFYLQEAPRAKPPAVVGGVPEFSAALHRDPDQLVYRRGRTPTLGGLWRSANRQSDDAVSDRANSDDLARRLLLRLQLHLRLRNFLHPARLRAGPGGGLVLPPAAAVPNRPMSVVGEHHLAPAAHHVGEGE